MFWRISEQFSYRDQGHKINSSRSINWQPRETSVPCPSEDCILPRASQVSGKFQDKAVCLLSGEILLTISLLFSSKVFAAFFHWSWELSWNILVFSATTHQKLLLMSCPNVFTVLTFFHHGPLTENGLLYWKRAERYFDTGIWEYSVFKVYTWFTFSVKKIYLHFTIRKCT